MASLAAIIVAAGSSRRMGFDKLTAPLAGQPLLAHTLAAFQDAPSVERIVLVASERRLAEFDELRRPFAKVAAVVPGGGERVESVLAGVDALHGAGSAFVAVHDGARPLIMPETIERCFAEAVAHGAAVCAEPETDTLHRADDEGFARETVSRQRLWRMQTPQIMETAVLRRILEVAASEGSAVTDEISLLVRQGLPAKIVDTGDWNFKVTYPRDIALAEAILRARAR